jgi:transposase InsO family protein
MGVILKEKSTTFDIFKSLKNSIENESGYKIKTLRSDRGGEFTSKLLQDFCRQAGIYQ